MGILGNMEGYLVDVQLHHVGVGMWQRQRRADASRRADCTEQIGVLIALIGRLGGPRSALRPLPDKAILLADPCFVLEPDLDLLASGYTREMAAKRAGPVFLKASMTSPSCLGCRGRALMWEKPSALSNLPMVRS